MLERARATGSVDPSPEAVLAALRDIAMTAAESGQGPSAGLVRVVPDLIGVALAGSVTASARALAALAPALAAPADGARLWGLGRRVATRDAVLGNAFAAHVLDFDDDETELAMAHLSVTLVSAALTLADALPGPISGRRLFGAVSAGYAIALALGEMVNPGMYRAGWHATATLGSFASAAACGSLLQLDSDRMARALCLAASLSGGVRGAFGGEGKPLQVGQAAASGLMAAQLAQAGFNAPTAALVGPRGFLGLHSGKVPTTLRSWPLPPPGFVVKAYPTCTAIHAAAAAVLEAVASLPAGARIERIDCSVDPFVPGILLGGKPGNPDEARFNMAYCLARAALDRQLGPDAFRPEALDDPTVAALMAHVHVHEASDLPKGPSGVATGAHVSIRAAGREVRVSRLAAPGSAAAPLSEAELLTKFSLCLESFCTPDVARQHFSKLLGLAEADDIMTVLDPLFALAAQPAHNDPETL